LVAHCLGGFLFGFCLETSWPLALYSQETEEGVSEANVGIAASLCISISNAGAAVLAVLIPAIQNEPSKFCRCTCRANSLYRAMECREEKIVTYRLRPWEGDFKQKI
jgi:hypothetical protein